jgi:menaquinone-dependent protoporphyrinogen oxidase
MISKALIVYGSRFGATKGTAEEIGGTLQNKGVDVRIVNAKKEKIDDISEYELVIVGSGMMWDRWIPEIEKFLEKFQKELSGKKVALFVSSGIQPLIEKEGRLPFGNPKGKADATDPAEIIGRARKVYLEEKAAKYNLQPLALGLFGGLLGNNAPWWSRRLMSSLSSRLKEKGFSEVKPGTYDTRDMNAIRNWTEELLARI